MNYNSNKKYRRMKWTKKFIWRTQFSWNKLLTISTIFCNWCNCKRTQVIINDKGAILLFYKNTHSVWAKFVSDNVAISQSWCNLIFGKLWRKINSGQQIFYGWNIFDVKNNLIDIANNFIKVRDITYAWYGFCPPGKRQIVRPEGRCSEAPDVVTWVDTLLQRLWSI